MKWWSRLKSWVSDRRPGDGARARLKEIGSRKIVHLEDYREARKAAGKQVAGRDG
ncbi:MAG: hypothetical protein KC466_06860 [Myxococcales bacterium]|nr:hypothetical protein [Myxococcales bacterium]